MNVCFVSDLHVDISSNNQKMVTYLVERLEQLEPNVFLILGDISPDIEELQQTLLKFSHLSCHKLLVQGNHDVWILSKRQRQKKGLDSYRKYHEIINEACQKSGFQHLGVNPFLMDKIGFIGSIGWYDYSFRNLDLDTKITANAYKDKKFGHQNTQLIWQDGEYAYWGIGADSKNWRVRRLCLRVPDEKIVQQQIDFLESSISALKSKGAQMIVCATHFLPFRELIEYTGKIDSDYFCAFLGSARIGEFIQSEPLIKYVLYGHDHRKKVAEINNRIIVSNPIGYLDNFQGDWNQYAKECLTCLTIESP